MSTSTSPRNVVLFFINGFGDAFINFPALRALAAHFGDTLTLICDDGKQIVIYGELGIPRIISISCTYSHTGREFDPEQLAGFIGKCDLFVSLVPWCSDSLSRLLELLAPKYSVGFFQAYDIALRLDYGKHAADLGFDIVRHFAPTLSIETFATPLHFSPETVDAVRRLRNILPAHARVMTLHPETRKEKMWDRQSLVTTLSVVLQQHTDLYAFVVAESDWLSEAEAKSDRFIPCFGLDFELACTLVASSDIFLGVDSCMLHVADLSRVPAIGLFGPTDPHEFGTRFGPHITVQSKNARMDNITSTTVVNAVNALLECPVASETWRV